MKLLEHIKQLNAKTRAWITEDPNARYWMGLYDEDVEYWAQYGIHTVEDFEQYKQELDTLVKELRCAAEDVVLRRMWANGN